MSMSMSLFPGLGRIHCHCLHSSLPLTRSRCRTTTLASSNALSQASPPNPHFAVREYLVQSCGLSSDEALNVSSYINHLKSPDKPNAVLHFLREVGVSESDIRTVVSKEPLLLCCSVEKNVRPNIEKLLEVGISIQDISGIITRRPRLLRHNFVPKIDFLMQALGSAQFLFVALKGHPPLLSFSLEKVLIPNLSFLKQECGFSPAQILRLIRSRSFSSRPQVLKRYAERADKLGIPRSSKLFLYALILCANLNEEAIDARLNNLRNLGLSQEEVTLLIRKHPLVLKASEETIARKLEFLTEEAGCDIAHLLQYPYLLSMSLENRLIPRTTVLNLLKSKGIQVENLKFATFVRLSDEIFVKRFVLPYEKDIPGLHQAYAEVGLYKDDDLLMIISN